MRSSNERRLPPCEGSFSPSQGSVLAHTRNLAKGQTNLRKVFRRGAAAFSLLEVVVSIAILGGVITALMVARSNAQEKHLIAAQMMTATRLAGSQAALLRAGAVGPGEGTFDGWSEYRWRIAAVSESGGDPNGLRKYELRVWPQSHEEDAAVTLYVWTLEQTGVNQ